LAQRSFHQPPAAHKRLDYAHEIPGLNDQELGKGAPGFILQRRSTYPINRGTAWFDRQTAA
jgi:hypothetical protein